MIAPVMEPAPESREELIQHLQRLAGRTLKTREDVTAYVHAVRARTAADQPSVQRWLKAKKLTLMALFAFSVIQYYILDVMLEITTIRSTTYFVPAPAQTQRS